jgi:glycine/D-amino acid oxidase-like deaminating enzyme
MLSFWEQSQMINFDLVVIGGGISGLFCALTYRQQNPKARIAVLERGLFSSGASTKNAGFACFGSLTELIDDATRMDTDTLLEIVELRVRGLERLRKTLGDSTIDFQQLGGYELFFEDQPKALELMDHFNRLLQPIFNQPVYTLNHPKINDFGFSSKHIKSLIENPWEGQINTGKMMKALRSKVDQQGISFYSHCEVTHFERHPKQYKVYVNSPFQKIGLKTQKLAVCNNSFAGRFFKDFDLKPGRGLVLMTKPIPSLPIKGSFHYHEGYYYFRNIDNRVLFGGGREQDFMGETTTEFGINPKIKEKLLNDLNAFILPEGNGSIEMEWSGIMAFGKSKKPIVKKVDTHAAVGIRLGGMGIAIGSTVGKQTAELLFD